MHMKDVVSENLALKFNLTSSIQNSKTCFITLEIAYGTVTTRDCYEHGYYFWD